MTTLATIECVVSVSLYVGIGIYYQTFRHLLIAIAVAPLMLFRTDASVRWGIKIFQIIIMKTPIKVPKGGCLVSTLFLWSLPLVLCAYTASGVVIRVIATLYWTLRRPLYTLSEMPENWLRQNFCTDFFYPPELLPLEHIYAHGKFLTFAGAIQMLVETGERHTVVQWIARMHFLVLLSPIIVLGYLPSVCYRISFKATSLVYFPFIWAAKRTLQSAPSVRLRLQRITKSELEKVGRYASMFALMLGAAKIGIAFGWAAVSALIARFPELMFVETLIVPDIWPWWLFVLWSAALLNFALFYYADAALYRLDATYKDAWPEQDVITIVSIFSFLRASLGVVAMAYFFQRALMAVVGSYFVIPHV
jgi:hypothetical protein